MKWLENGQNGKKRYFLKTTSFPLLSYFTLYFGRRWFADQTINPIPNLTKQIRISGGDLHSLKLAAKAPENSFQAPEGNDRIPTTSIFRCKMWISGGTFILTRSFCDEKRLSNEDSLPFLLLETRPCWSQNPAKIFWRRQKEGFIPFLLDGDGRKKREVGWWIVFIVSVDWFKGKIPNCVHVSPRWYFWWFRNPKPPPFGCKKAVVNDGIRYLSLNWWGYRISEPSTVSRNCL